MTSRALMKWFNLKIPLSTDGYPEYLVSSHPLRFITHARYRSIAMWGREEAHILINTRIGWKLPLGRHYSSRNEQTLTNEILQGI